MFSRLSNLLHQTTNSHLSTTSNSSNHQSVELQDTPQLKFIQVKPRAYSNVQEDEQIFQEVMSNCVHPFPFNTIAAKRERSMSGIAAN